jgi:hypothetical protein
MAAPISKIVRRPSNWKKTSDFCIGLTIDPVTIAAINALRDKLAYIPFRRPWNSTQMFYAMPGRHLEYTVDNLTEFTSQESSFTMDFGPPFSRFHHGKCHIGLTIPSPLLIDLRMRLSVSLKIVLEDMARNPVSAAKNPSYTNMRSFKPSVTISHSIPATAGNFDDEPARRIMKLLELEYARGIAPVKAVGLYIFEQPKLYQKCQNSDRIEFSFKTRNEKAIH